eukprot:759383-Hanusia_phi.AAC.4
MLLYFYHNMLVVVRLHTNAASAAFSEEGTASRNSLTCTNSVRVRLQLRGWRGGEEGRRGGGMWSRSREPQRRGSWVRGEGTGWKNNVNDINRDEGSRSENRV